MSTETQPTAAELLAEWKRYNEVRVLAFVRDDGQNEWAYQHECNKRAAQLDEMCDDAGIMLIGGVFTYHWRSLSISTMVRNGIQAYTVTANRIDGREQQALQEWLLVKADNSKKAPQ